MAEQNHTGVVYGVYQGSYGSGISVIPCGMAKTNSGKNGKNGRITKPQRTLCINYLDCLTAYEFGGGVRCKATNAGSIPRPAVVGRSMSKATAKKRTNDTVDAVAADLA
jgi:hypothetical protein